MRAASRLRLADSILSRTVLLVFATVLLLTAVNVGIILLRSPPFNAPLSAREIARLLNDQPIVNKAHVKLTYAAALPADLRPANNDDPVRSAIAQRLGIPASSVRLNHTGSNKPGPPGYEASIRNEFEMYAADGDFNPLVFGPFSAAVRKPDGRWAIVSSVPDDLFANWQQGMILRFMLTLLVVLPIAWLFARRLAKPIKSFAEAAERLGRRHQAEPVIVEGPAEIRQASAAINDMQFRLQRYLAERTSMVGAIAHDLRTPLSRLHFQLAKAPDDIRSRAETEIQEMEMLIATTLDFVQSEGRPRVKDQVDLGLLVESVVDDFADLGHDVFVVASQPATITGDPVLLKRLFSNLVSNAIAYGCKAEVLLRLEGRQAIVEIADRGPGLTPYDLERAFEPFYRAEVSRNRSTGGMGLGLAIVQDAVAAHEGEVKLSNRTGGGLCVAVSLPLTS